MPAWLDWMLGRSPSAGKNITITRDPAAFVTELRGWDTPVFASDTAALQQAQQRRNELVFACIDIKASAAHDPRLMVQQATRRRGALIWEEVPDHPLRQLLTHPNKWMSEADLMRAAIVSWHVSNPRRVYLLKEYRNNFLVGLHPLNPAAMTSIDSRQRPGTTIGYEWREGSQRETYSLEELIIRAAPPWYDPPPLVAALGAVESDTAQTQYIRDFFTNGGIPPGILKYDMPLRQEQRDEIREKWRATYSRQYNRSHDIGVLDVHAEYQQTGANLSDLGSDILRSVAESRICMVFGVPPLIVYAYVGLMRATYSNLKEAWASFWDATMSPEFKAWRMAWQRLLLPEFEEGHAIERGLVRLQYDMSQVSALQDDLDTMQARAERAFRAGGMTLNEYRSACNLPSDPAGDYYIRSMGAVAYPLGQAAPPPLDPGKAAKDRERPSVQLIERRMTQAVQRYLTSQYQQAASDGEAALDTGPAIRQVMTPWYTQLLGEAFHDANQAGLSIAFDLVRPEVVATLDQLARQIGRITDTTRQEIRDLIGRQQTEGWSTADLAQAIVDAGHVRSPIRALTIARTETGTAYNLGSLAAYGVAGLTHVDVVDGDTDEPCASANGARWTLAEAQANPLGHPNCTRAFLPVVEVPT